MLFVRRVDLEHPEQSLSQGVSRPTIRPRKEPYLPSDHIKLGYAIDTAAYEVLADRDNADLLEMEYEEASEFVQDLLSEGKDESILSLRITEQDRCRRNADH
jgi:hypothetical protein